MRQGSVAFGVFIPGGCRQHRHQVTAPAPHCSWVARSARVDFPVCPNVGSHRPTFQSSRRRLGGEPYAQGPMAVGLLRLGVCCPPASGPPATATVAAHVRGRHALRAGLYVHALPLASGTSGHKEGTEAQRGASGSAPLTAGARSSCSAVTCPLLCGARPAAASGQLGWWPVWGPRGHEGPRPAGEGDHQLFRGHGL